MALTVLSAFVALRARGITRVIWLAVATAEFHEGGVLSHAGIAQVKIGAEDRLAQLFIRLTFAGEAPLQNLHLFGVQPWATVLIGNA